MWRAGVCPSPRPSPRKRGEGEHAAAPRPARAGSGGGPRQREGERHSSARPEHDAPSEPLVGVPARPSAPPLAEHLARPPERVQLADDGAAAAVSGGAGRLSVLLRHSVEPAGPPGRACRHLCRAEEFRDQFQRPDLLAGGRQHLRLYRRRDVAEDGRRSRAGVGDEPAIPAEEPGARIAAVAVHRADRAEHGRLDVDPRSGVQRAATGF